MRCQSLGADRVRFDHLDLCYTLRAQRQRRTDADGPAAENQRADVSTCFRQSSQPQPHAMPTTGQRLGQRGRAQRDALRHLDDVSFRDRHQFGERPFARRDRYDLPRRADIGATRCAIPASAARDLRIDRHPLPVAWSALDGAGRLVPKDQWRGSTRIVPQKGVHVRSADA